MAKKIKLDKADDAEAPVVPKDGGAPEPPDYDRVAARLWPVEDDHGSVTRMLTQAADREVDLADAADEATAGGSNALNLVLLVLIIAAVGVGVWQLREVSSEETLKAKAAERAALEEQHLQEQLAKQKKYGVMRIESEPPQAVVIKDGEKLIAEVAAVATPPEADEAPAAPDGKPADGKAADGKAADGKPADGKAADGKATPDKAGDAKAAAGEAGDDKAGEAAAAPTGGNRQLVGMTPMNIMNLDIAQTYSIRLEKEGYEPFEFSVGQHLWTKDPNTGEYKFFKSVELTPINCEYYFLYDAKKRREVQFKDKAECLTHYDEAIAQQVSVTECVCKIPPEGVNPDKE